MSFILYQSSLQDSLGFRSLVCRMHTCAWAHVPSLAPTGSQNLERSILPTGQKASPFGFTDSRSLQVLERKRKERVNHSQCLLLRAGQAFHTNFFYSCSMNKIHAQLHGFAGISLCSLPSTKIWRQNRNNLPQTSEP